MRETLPPYIVECFLVSGFDDLDTIAEMNTDNGSKNSVSTIESYIDKRKAYLPQCLGPHHIATLDSFEFPPGHRIRIERFIKNIKCMYGSITKPIQTKPIQIKSKKRKVERSDNDDIPIATEEIRKKILKWNSSNCDGTLKEDRKSTR